MEYFIILILLMYVIYAVIPSMFFKIIFKLKRKEKGKTIYLTFDDGPNSVFTEKLLDVLKKYDIRASFFCVAKFAKENKNLIKRMKKEGHVIGLHSLKHQNAYLMDIFKTNKDFQNSLKIMKELETDIKYFRPPWGDLNLASLFNIRKYNLKLILWNVMAEDWKKDITSFDIELRLLRRIQGGDIICLHDGRGKKEAPRRTIEALDKALPILLGKDFIFETVDKYNEK